MLECIQCTVPDMEAVSKYYVSLMNWLPYLYKIQRHLHLYYYSQYHFVLISF